MFKFCVWSIEKYSPFLGKFRLSVKTIDDCIKLAEDMDDSKILESCHTNSEYIDAFTGTELKGLKPKMIIDYWPICE